MYLNRHTGESHDRGFDVLLGIMGAVLATAIIACVLHAPEIVAGLAELALLAT